MFEGTEIAVEYGGRERKRNLKRIFCRRKGGTRGKKTTH